MKQGSAEVQVHREMIQRCFRFSSCQHGCIHLNIEQLDIDEQRMIFPGCRFLGKDFRNA